MKNNAVRADLQSTVDEARETGNERQLAIALLRLCEVTPLFASHLDPMDEWLSETTDFAHRLVLEPSYEIRQSLRRAEWFLNKGMPWEAHSAAAETAQALIHMDGMVTYSDRASMIQARALVRLGRQDSAVQLFDALVNRDSTQEEEDPLVAGLAFVAAGEAHLFEGRYDLAARPLDLATNFLPEEGAGSRLRFDALCGLGMLDHRDAELETAMVRYTAALSLASGEQAMPEQISCHLLLSTLNRGLGLRNEAQKHCQAAFKLAKHTPACEESWTFPTERMRNLVGCTDLDSLGRQARIVARDCGSQGDLIGYAQLTALVSTVLDLQDKSGEAAALLQTVWEVLEADGYTAAGQLLRAQRAGYSD